MVGPGDRRGMPAAASSCRVSGITGHAARPRTAGSTSCNRPRRSSAWERRIGMGIPRLRRSRGYENMASPCSAPISGVRSPSPSRVMARSQSPTSVITIERFIMEQERLHPEATGELSNLLYDLCLAAKIISRQVRRAGLTDILGEVGTINVQGEVQQKLDVFANETVRNSVEHTGRVCVVASEEDEQPIPVQVREDRRGGKYVLLYDPLDGSTNIGVNVSIGTIFSIHRRTATKKGPGSLADCLQKGRAQVAAGYILYGSSTMLVYTTGQGVHGFTLDPTIGEFLLSHPDIRSPDVGTYYSVNESHWNKWAPGIQRVVGAFKNGDGGRVEAKSARYIGSLVADIHRNLMSGGVFLYPADTISPQGKLRLLYEAAPLAFVVEQAGGAAIDGERDILDIKPAALHQRTPLIIGSKHDVAFARSVLAGR